MGQILRDQRIHRWITSVSKVFDSLHIKALVALHNKIQIGQFFLVFICGLVSS